jgi:norsolorinic acid ketoreductase
MTSPNSQVWFISGGNRGIGFAIVENLAARPETVVFAGVRSTAQATALQQLASQNPNVHIVKLESTSVSDAAAAANTVESISGGLDVVIANAGISNNYRLVTEADIDSFQEHWQVNTMGPLILFQALYSLLRKRQTRKFVTMSSMAGSISKMFPVPLTAYGASKAALNYITKSIHRENNGDGFIVFPIRPGGVDTDMGKMAAPFFGVPKFSVTPEESAAGVLAVIDRATSEQSGRFWGYDGYEAPW